ncbi:hypothetical protein BWQ96_06250 [Gracilariopsis chorda]|uniref:HAT C-terminal dimerisation domain-containing protein n=1 Tax=Gracilariopsis chorda TaxID=448386 RepID=A0A2V3IPN5_9FLOR|nr:hypothetical protein BWQ96_06250 [Gracilariopsis chorda]|eukprot:PXF44017.1 hypothetical protein BWQ96_06250 [Gracilariopsis chorda]
MSDTEAQQRHDAVCEAVFDLAKSHESHVTEPRHQTQDIKDANCQNFIAQPEINAASDRLWNFSEFEENTAALQPPIVSLEDEVMEEFQSYVTGERVRATELNSNRLLMWWKSKECCYLYLSRVTKSVLGRPASSAHIERD